MECELHTAPFSFTKGGSKPSSPESGLAFPSTGIVLYLSFAFLCTCYQCRIGFAEYCYVHFCGKSRQWNTEFKEIMPLENLCDIRICSLPSSNQSYAPNKTKFEQFHTSGSLLMWYLFWGIKACLFQPCNSPSPISIVSNVILCGKWLIFSLFFFH